MTLLTSGAEPCAKCGTEGGLNKRNSRRPARTQGLCQRCYDNERNHSDSAGREVCLPPAGDLADLIPVPRHHKRWRGAWESEEWSRTVAYEVARGAAWRAARGLAA